jgi:N-acetylmuramoyl-L-alanine amidase
LKIFYKYFIHFLFFTSIIFAQSIPKSELSLNITKYNKIEYISLNEFIKSHELKSTYYQSKEKLEVIFENKKMYFSPLSSYFKIDNKVYHLTYDVILKNNALHVPLLPFYHILESINMPVQLIESKKNIARVLTNIYNVKDFNIQNKTNGIVLSIKTTKKFPKKHIATSINKSGWLNITILNSAIDSMGIKNSQLTYPVTKINSIQQKQSGQLSFLINKKIDDISLNTTDNYIELLLSIEQSKNSEKIKELREKWIIDTIVIDPGHGGKDPGAIGVDNIKEKEITLNISKQLGKMIERNLGLKVIYTRDEDVFIPLWKRTQIANNSGGDMFISIHANSANHKIKGFETYLLRIGKTEAAIEVAKRENETIKLEEKNHQYIDFSDAKKIVATITQNSAMKGSEFLAERIQANLSKRLNSTDRGVKQAGFHVLVGASMPNVLVEVGFVTNKYEAKQLTKAQYKREIAKGLFEAVVDFKNKYEKQ